MLHNYVGQRDALAPLIAAIEATKATGRPLPHALFLGKPGVGKTQLARSVAEEIGGPFVTLNCATVTEPAVLATAAVAAQGGVLFLDETHALDRKQAESAFTLLDEGTVTVQRPVMGETWGYEQVDRPEDMPLGSWSKWTEPGLYPVPVPYETRATEPESIILSGVTVIGATTDEALIPPALLSRLSRLVVRLRPYSDVELATIATLYAEEDLALTLEPKAAILVAQRARQSPRRCKQLTERASDYPAGASRDAITEEDVEAALAASNVDTLGLEEPHRTILRILVESGGVSRTSLAQRVGIPMRNLQLYWGDLMEAGLVTIGRRHEATAAGEAALR